MKRCGGLILAVLRFIRLRTGFAVDFSDRIEGSRNIELSPQLADMGGALAGIKRTRQFLRGMPPKSACLAPQAL